MKRQQESTLSVLQSVEKVRSQIVIVDKESRRVKSIGKQNVRNLQVLGEELEKSGRR